MGRVGASRGYFGIVAKCSRGMPASPRRLIRSASNFIVRLREVPGASGKPCDGGRDEPAEAQHRRVRSGDVRDGDRPDGGHHEGQLRRRVHRADHLQPRLLQHHRRDQRLIRT